MIIPKALDLTGCKYGKLTVLERVDNYITPQGKKKARWKVQCDCGNVFESQTSNIRSGKNQCWECAHKATGEKRRKNIEGQTFGYLTVLSIDRRRDNRGKIRSYCLCKCVCGNEIEVLMDTLMSKYELHSCGCARKEIAGKHLSKDILGQKFNRLTVIEEYVECTPREVLCECECGNFIRLKKTEVMSGHTKSCGCLQAERASESNTKNQSGSISEYNITINNPVRQNEKGVWLYDCTCHCGNHFEARPIDIMNGSIKSCGCIVESSGEYYIRKYLTENNIRHIPQYTFDDCRNVYPLHFDFAIINKDSSVQSLIEYDGKQHYEPINYFGGEERFKEQKQRDKIKDEYCKKNNIPLIRIPYFYTIDEIKQTLANIK